MRRPALSLALGACMLSGCTGPTALAPAKGGLRVTGETGPLGFDEGARARRIADTTCGPRGVRSSINDRFDAGTWVFPGGCA